MAPIELQSEDHRNLLDIVDKLRLIGITRYIDLPQIVVCGDQSAGKSSVLEAISGIRFPTKDNLCTRFATELVLRRNESSGVKVSITAGPERNEEECQRLSKFKHDVDITDPDLGGLIEEAKQAMGLSETKVFSSDTLRMELQGPEQPHLTLVDLPGLFRAGNREQSVVEAPIVHQMVRSYMERPRSIILAVVSAKSDFALQEVTKYAHEFDPRGERTLGLITKPDTLSKDSDSETAYVTMAQNKDVVFRLGWHVLKNRSFETRNASTELRDFEEARFFQAGVWASLNPSTVGIASLKPRLSNILRDQILNNLPSLRADISSGVEDCEFRLKQMGEARSTPQEQRRYLQSVSWKFSVLLKAAIDGVYNDRFFGHASTKEGQQKRLRAVVRNILDDFAETLRTRGQFQLIVEDDEEDPDVDPDISHVWNNAYVASVKELMRHSRGTELPGTFNPSIIGELFRKQCQPWQAIVTRVRQTVLQSVRWSTRAILVEVAVGDTVDALFALVDRLITGLAHNVHAKINELLRPHLEGDPITYNHYLISNVQKIQAKRRRQQLRTAVRKMFRDDYSSETLYNTNVETFVTTIDEHEEVDMGNHAAQLAVDYMQAYYKVALKTCVDDVSIHAIEEQLIQKLPPLFDPESLERLSDAEVAHLAAERPTVADDRAHCVEKLDSLRVALRELDSLDKHELETDASVSPIPDVRNGSLTPQEYMDEEIDATSAENLVPEREVEVMQATDAPEVTCELAAQASNPTAPEPEQEFWGFASSKKVKKETNKKKRASMAGWGTT